MQENRALLMVLLNEDKAIVSVIHGTTRDVIEDTVNIGGITFRFIDTAGIVRLMIPSRVWVLNVPSQKLDQAEIVLWMIDATDAKSQMEELSGKILPRCQNKHLIVVFNKSDLIREEQKKDIISLLSSFSKEDISSIFISARQRSGTDELQQTLIETAHLPTITQNDVIVTNVRHYEALSVHWMPYTGYKTDWMRIFPEIF